MNVHFSSKKNDWETPQDLFDKLHKIHNFMLDACATKDNAKVNIYLYSLETAIIENRLPHCSNNDGLFADWAQIIESIKISSKVVPSNASWWHDYVIKCYNIELIVKCK